MPPMSVELARLRSGGDDELSPKASADAMRTWIGKGTKIKSE